MAVQRYRKPDGTWGVLQGGNDVANVYLPRYAELTDDELAKNRDAFEKIKNGAPIQFAINLLGEPVYFDNPCIYQYISEEDVVGIMVESKHVISGGGVITSVLYMEEDYVLLPDGNIILESSREERPSTPASSGPLRVWWNEENTPEQLAENIATRNSLLANPYQSVLLCCEYDYTEYGEGIIKSTRTADNVTVGNGEVVIGIITRNLDGDLNIISQKLESFLIQEDGTISI